MSIIPQRANFKGNSGGLSLTINLDREKPGYTRNDEYFVLRVLNGMNPALFKLKKDNPNQLKVTFDWDDYEKDNGGIRDY
ncbi:hypothetical protein [Cylindrospermopsis curvispora]|uniref:hypothetical protein n=1 Tax=Cylindrospermopsis curvispora TaxID=747548 RepID=UPI001CA72E18|nr:hypothetical protein [Cylindrospermopsis curvispora]